MTPCWVGGPPVIFHVWISWCVKPAVWTLSWHWAWPDQGASVAGSEMWSGVFSGVATGEDRGALAGVLAGTWASALPVRRRRTTQGGVFRRLWVWVAIELAGSAGVIFSFFPTARERS